MPATDPPAIPLRPGADPAAEAVDPNGLVTRVSAPLLIPFLAADGRSDGTAILVCPGGGYGLLDWQSHVVRLAARLNPLGLAVLALRYRTAPPSTRVPDDALDDLHAAIRLASVHAAAWRIRPDRLIGLGFSAGANLLLRHVCTPDGSGLAGLALLCLWPHGQPVEAYRLRPPPPRTLLCVSEADPVAPVAFSRGIDAALRAAGGDSTLATFAQGGHLAFNFRPDGTPEVDWTPAFLAWLAARPAAA